MKFAGIHSCQNNFPLPMQLCLYQADFFIFDKKNSCQVNVNIFINQKSLVPSISKRKRASENQPYNKQHMVATRLFIPKAEEFFQS